MPPLTLSFCKIQYVGSAIATMPRANPAPILKKYINTADSIFSILPTYFCLRRVKVNTLTIRNAFGDRGLVPLTPIPRRMAGQTTELFDIAKGLSVSAATSRVRCRRCGLCSSAALRPLNPLALDCLLPPLCRLFNI